MNITCPASFQQTVEEGTDIMKLVFKATADDTELELDDDNVDRLLGDTDWEQLGEDELERRYERCVTARTTIPPPAFVIVSNHNVCVAGTRGALMHWRTKTTSRSSCAPCQL